MRTEQNTVALIGVVLSTREVQDINGAPFTGYKMELGIKRKSGVIDELIVMAEGEAPGNGDTALVIGKVQAQKNFNSGHTLIYCMAEEVRAIEAKHWEYENDVKIIGEIGKGTTHRITPRGKEIADVFLKVDNVLYNSQTYIPCVMWQENAERVQSCTQGDKVEVTGRLQSRTYVKVLPDGTAEERTAYEVSVKELNIL